MNLFFFIYLCCCLALFPADHIFKLIGVLPFPFLSALYDAGSLTSLWIDCCPPRFLFSAPLFPRYFPLMKTTTSLNIVYLLPECFLPIFSPRLLALLLLALRVKSDLISSHLVSSLYQIFQETYQDLAFPLRKRYTPGLGPRRHRSRPAPLPTWFPHLGPLCGFDRSILQSPLWPKRRKRCRPTSIARLLQVSFQPLPPSVPCTNKNPSSLARVVLTERKDRYQTAGDRHPTPNTFRS